MKGTITKLGNGYGFICLDTSPDKEIFFHVSELMDIPFQDLKVKDRVVFELETQGIIAKKIRRI